MSLNEIVPVSEEVSKIISDLENGKTNCFVIPDQYANDFQIILTERKLRMRKIGKRGFDIIRGKFFVEEEMKTDFRKKTVQSWFDDFKSYYDFVEGKIYTKACYYQCDIPQVDGIKINLEKWNKCGPFVKETLNDFRYAYKNDRYYKNLEDDKVECKVYKKAYRTNDGSYSSFEVSADWLYEGKKIACFERRSFDYFFDFITFLGGDLSGADLLYCDGLMNLKDITGLEFAGATLTSKVSEKFGIPYVKYSLPVDYIENFATSENNDLDTELILSENIHKYDYRDEDASIKLISYITDLHLLHTLSKFNIKSEADLYYHIDHIARSVIGTGTTLLIGGDVCSDYEIFKIFVRNLRRYKRSYQDIFFVLGNHELWSFKNHSIEDIVGIYRDFLKENDMYLLHNDVVYIEDEGYLRDKMRFISTDELMDLDIKSIRDKLLFARYIFFGGLAFSGYDEEFNANKGIYRGVISREEEIKQSTIFEGLHDKLYEAIPDKKVIVLTHMPMESWRLSIKYPKNYIYVSGHTHKNYFYDDGEVRIYADNQIGYKSVTLRPKQFMYDTSVDYFSDWDDGIYRIGAEQYSLFLRGKCMSASVHKLSSSVYMLKKSGYYCFIRELANGSLSILHGGRSKGLERKDVKYYFDRMDSVIDFIEKPLKTYTEFQKKISNEIKKIGGSGKIHGCIIDIDFFDHVFVNPLDLKITAYNAKDKIEKYVYPSIAALLKDQCHELYVRYSNELEQSQSDLKELMATSSEVSNIVPTRYSNTDIYNVSEVLRRMQRLKSKILTLWTEPAFGQEISELTDNNLKEE